MPQYCVQVAVIEFEIEAEPLYVIIAGEVVDGVMLTFFDLKPSRLKALADGPVRVDGVLFRVGENSDVICIADKNRARELFIPPVIEVVIQIDV